MKTHFVNDQQEACSVCIKFIFDKLEKTNSKVNIALTGGRYGEFFIAEFFNKSPPLNKLRFFQTDERFVSLNSPESIQSMIVKHLQSQKDYDSNFFDTSKDPSQSAEDMKNKLNELKLNSFDITILSLGEDGHLAGNFPNSENLESIITYTNHAPKMPRKRISFSIEWLFRSKYVFILAIGNEKLLALNNLLSGRGMFPLLDLSSENIFLIRT